jgi:hypothetical protein
VVSIIANDYMSMLTKLCPQFKILQFPQCHMRWEEVHVKWCLTWCWDFDAEVVVSDSINVQVLHWVTRQGNVIKDKQIVQHSYIHSLATVSLTISDRVSITSFWNCGEVYFVFFGYLFAIFSKWGSWAKLKISECIYCKYRLPDVCSLKSDRILLISTK